MHGLPPDKKRELEHLLKTFTLGLSPSIPSRPSSPHAVDVSESVPNQLASKPQLHPGTVSAVDSGYVSNTASAVNPAANSANLRTSEPISQSNRDRSIKNYLHDIPNSLLPQGTLAIDENAKMALVVQRLEQLFLGKSAVPGEHSLPVQQQKISRSAARADRREDIKFNRSMKGEGLREARMLPQESKTVLDVLQSKREHESSDLTAKSQPESGSTSDGAGSGSGHSSPGQRPTRPLDLDIERAQVVEDNISYIRHLGFSSPLYDRPSSKKEQPWIYLNLLIGMAQLHTLNVTPAFVRKAVKKLSTRFEVSKDEQKIRWKGDYGEYAWPDPQQSPNSALQRGSDDAGDETGGRSRRSVTSTLNEQGSTSVSEDRAVQSGNSKSLQSTNSTLPHAGLSSHPSKSSVFEYKPIVYQGKRVHMKPSYLTSSISQGSVGLRSRRLGHVSSLPGLKPKDDCGEGVVTFFNNAYFCEDLSGDGDHLNMKTESCSSSTNVLGISDVPSLSEDNLRDAKACYFMVGDPLEGQSEEVVGRDCLEIAMPMHAIACAGEDETQPLELPASGIGGVKPEENFALDVKVVRTRKPVGIQSKTRSRSLFDYRIAACSKLGLRPSQLPPPSYVFFTSSSASSAGEDQDSSGSSDASSELDDSPAPAGYMWQWTSSSQENLGDEDVDSDNSSMVGASEAVRARQEDSVEMTGPESEYMVKQAGRTVSGSLAATVGASLSAASLMDHEERHEGDVEMQQD
jgi:hypothetical protein